MSLRIEIITDIEHKKKLLLEAWKCFSPHAVPSGLAIGHLISWWAQYGNVNNSRIGFDKRPLIILIYSGGKLTGILPLMMVRRFKKKIFCLTSLEFLTQSFTGQFLDIVQDKMTVDEIESVFKQIRKLFKYDLVDLCYLKEDSILFKAELGKNMFHSGKVIIPLSYSYEHIRKNIYSKNLRHILNKFNRRIKESNDNIWFEIIEGKENINKIKNSIKKASLSKLSDSNMHSPYNNPDIGEMYFNSIINTENPFCSVYFSDDELLSYNMGYIKHGVVYALDAAYNRCYSDSKKIGLGILAYDNLVAKYAGCFNELDMGFGLDDYKFRFSKTVRYSKKLRITGNTWKGKIYCWYLDMKDNNKTTRESQKR